MAALTRPVLAVGAVILVTACSEARTPHASDPGMPTAPATAAPSPTHRAAAPPCTVDQIAVGRPLVAGAMGTVYYLYPIRLRSRPSCTVTGVPAATALDGDRPAAVRVVPEPPGAGRWSGRSVPIGTHRPAWISVGWDQPAAYVCTAARVSVTAVRLVLPGGTLDLPGRRLGAASGCQGDTPSGGPPSLSLSPFYARH